MPVAKENFFAGVYTHYLHFGYKYYYKLTERKFDNLKMAVNDGSIGQHILADVRFLKLDEVGWLVIKKKIRCS